MVDKTPAELDPGTPSDTSVVHASENGVSTNSKGHDERDISRLQGTAPNYSATKTYNLNDLVTQGAIVYRNIIAIIIPESFAASKWEAFALVDTANIFSAAQSFGILDYTDAIDTIAAGVLTATVTYQSVAGEGAADDDLDTITAGTTGQYLIIRPSDDAVTITVTSAGNIFLIGGNDFVMDDIEDTMTLIYDGTNWIEISRNEVGGGGITSINTDTTAAQTIAAGAGLGIVDAGATHTLSVGAGTGITVNANDVQISATYPGQISIDTLGTITSGTWNGTDIDFANIQTISTSSILGRITAATGDIEVLTGTQATTLIDTFTSALKGLAPASGGGTANFLRADGSWVDPISSVPDIKSGADTVALDGTTTVSFNTAFATVPNVVLNFSGNVDYAASEKGLNLSVYNITVNGFTVRYDQFDGTEDPASFQWIATSAGDP